MEIRIKADRILTESEIRKIEDIGIGEPIADWPEGPDTKEGVENMWMGYGVYFIGHDDGHESISQDEFDETHEACGVIESMGFHWGIEGNGPWADSEVRGMDAFKRGLNPIPEREDFP